MEHSYFRAIQSGWQSSRDRLQDETARLWDVPAIGRKDTVDDVLLLADLGEATGGVSLPASSSTETLNFLRAEQVRAIRNKIAVKFSEPSLTLTPLQRFLKWSVLEQTNRTVSPFSKLTFHESVENRINEGTLASLRAAVFVNPANARAAAKFGWCCAEYSGLEKEIGPDFAARHGRKPTFKRVAPVSSLRMTTKLRNCGRE